MPPSHPPKTAHAPVTAKKRPGSAPAAQAVREAVQPAAAPAVLLPMQQSWVGDPADVAVWEKSRRIGASWCTASVAVLTAGATADAGGMDALYIGYSEDMTREFIDDCAMWARSFNRAAGAMQELLFEDTTDDGDVRQIKAFRIDFDSGFKVLALSSRPRSIRGKQGLVIIDEAAFHDDLPGLLKAAMAMLIWGGRVRILSSHNGEDNPFNLLVKDIRAGKLPYSLHRTTFDDALNDGLFERVKLVMGARFKYASRDAWRTAIRAQYGEGAAEELDCIPAMGGGVYLPRTLVEHCQSDDCVVIRWVKPPEWTLNPNRLAETDRWIADVLKPVIDNLPNVRSVLGRDFGRSGDLSVEGVMQEIAPRKWRATLTVELRNIPFDVQQKVNLWLIANLPLFEHAKFDARGNGQQLAEAALQKFGVSRIECVMATPTWYAENFPPYKAALEGRNIELPRDEDEIADHRRVVLKNGYPTMDAGSDKGSDGGQRHGDRVVARVMAWAAARSEAVPIEYQSTGQRRLGAMIDAPVRAISGDTGFGAVAGGNDFGGF
jgi:phage FluMu gp28-like protein